MYEVLLHVEFLKNRAGKTIECMCGGACAHGTFRSLFRIANGGECPLLLRSFLAREEHTTLIGAITAEARAHINLYDVAFLERARRWVMMRTAGMCAKRYDRIEGKIVGSQIFGPGSKFSRDLTFGDTGTQYRGNTAKHLMRDALRFAKHAHFTRIFGATKVSHDILLRLKLR